MQLVERFSDALRGAVPSRAILCFVGLKSSNVRRSQGRPPTAVTKEILLL